MGYPGDARGVVTLIIGASVAGVRTAQSLRTRGYMGQIAIVGEERHRPYDKPPLSKEMLSADGGAPIPLLSDEELERLDVDLRLGTRATGLDLARRQVLTATGEALDFDDLVIATGVKARTLPGADELMGVFTLRTADDASAIHASLAAASRILVVGAGFIGAEVASAATKRGVQVTMVEPQPVPMAHLLGAEVGAMLATLHTINGVEMYTDVGVSGFLGADAVTGVRLTDGRQLKADLVVVGIGAAPATEWLTSSGLRIQDGVVCDSRLRALGADRVYAAGDVARWESPFVAEPVRIEHWTNAQEHAELVATTILGLDPPPAQPAYVWSDQYGHRIQIVGRPSTGAEVRITGDVHGGDLSAVYLDAEERVVGALVMDNPRTTVKCRRAVARGARFEDIGVRV
jgi:NADPH-dependent 2,4-dienoyl-CoA reductase/sulfur reductase-like enzyme